jgi:hypothetical protein
VGSCWLGFFFLVGVLSPFQDAFGTPMDICTKMDDEIDFYFEDDNGVTIFGYLTSLLFFDVGLRLHST